jgi:hypothetical protein
MSRARFAVVVTLATVVSACGGGGKKGPSMSTSLSIGAETTLAKGRTLSAAAAFSQDGVPSDCTATAQWASSDEAVATVADGVITASNVGRTTISATCSGTTGAAVLDVTPAEVVSVVIEPTTGELPDGLAEQLVAIATLTDGTRHDYTSDVTWTSSDPTVFTVSNDNPREGVLSALPAYGQQATITAVHAASGAQATVARTVAPAGVTLTSVSPWPSGPSLALGKGGQFVLTGTFTDSQQANVTPSFSWSALPAGIAEFNPFYHPGGVRAVGIGVTTITATAAVAAAGSLTASTTLTVTPAVVESVVIAPPSATVIAGSTLQLTGIAIKTDNTRQTVTLSDWSSSVPGAASVSSAGVLEAATAGLSTIRASYATDTDTFTPTTQVQVVAPTSAAVLSYLSLSTDVQMGSGSVTGTVGLAAPAPAATTIALETSDPLYAPVQASVVLPRGSSSATFPIAFTAPTGRTLVTITARLGSASKTAAVDLWR